MHHQNYTGAPVVAIKPKVSIMGKIFLVVFFIVLFEGAIRKWISPSLTNPLVLTRDVLALYGVYWALNRNKLKTGSLIFKILLLWTAVVVLWGLVQLIFNQNPPLIYLIGLRFWLLYLWFACAAAVAMTENDFRIIIKVIMIITLCMTPLIVLQFYSPPGAFINKQIGGDEDKVFLLAANVVRTTGFFSFTAGQSTLLAVVTPFVLSVLMGTTKFFKNKWLPIAVFLALTTCTMLSGSRSALATFIILFAIMIFLETFFAKGKSETKKFLVIALSLAVIMTIPFIFSTALDATTERVVSANESEPFFDRIQSMFFGEPGSQDAITFIGYGLGMGTNFVGILSNTKFALGETEIARTLMEGGIVGFIFVAFKISVVIIAFRKAFYIVRKTGNKLPFLLWVVLIIALFSWSIIGQLTINALGYILFGLGLASFRFSENKK